MDFPEEEPARPGDADWNVSTKELPEETAAPAGIDEWKTPSPLRKIERKGESTLVDRSKKTTKNPTPIGRVDPNGFAALLGTDLDEEDLAGVGSGDASINDAPPDKRSSACPGGAGEKTEPTSTRSGFRFGKFCSTKLLCVFLTVVVGLGCSAFALSSYGSGGVSSELLESVLVPDAAAIPTTPRATTTYTRATLITTFLAVLHSGVGDAKPCDRFVVRGEIRCAPAIFGPGLGKCGTNELRQILALHPKIIAGTKELRFDPAETAPQAFMEAYSDQHRVTPTDDKLWYVQANRYMNDRTLWGHVQPGTNASLLPARLLTAYPSAKVIIAICEPYEWAFRWWRFALTKVIINPARATDHECATIPGMQASQLSGPHADSGGMLAGSHLPAHTGTETWPRLLREAAVWLPRLDGWLQQKRGISLAQLYADTYEAPWAATDAAISNATLTHLAVLKRCYHGFGTTKYGIDRSFSDNYGALAHPVFNAGLWVDAWAESFPFGKRLGVSVMEDLNSPAMQRSLLSMLASPPWNLTSLVDAFPWDAAAERASRPHANSAATGSSSAIDASDSLLPRSQKPFRALTPMHEDRVRRSCSRLAQLLGRIPAWPGCVST